jgi:hypothetical protein
VFISARIWRSCDFHYAISSDTTLQFVLQSGKVLRDSMIFYLYFPSSIAGIFASAIAWRWAATGS